MDQLSSSASRTFNNAQPMSFQPINLSQFPMQTPPGLIPLFPVLPNNSNSSSSTLEPLTEEQIRLLETNTRAAFEEKIRILQEAQMQIYNVISVLTQAVSAFPSIPITATTSSTEENSLINNNNNEGGNNIGNANSTNFTNTNEVSQNEVKGNKGKGKSVTVTDEEESYN
jgi:hypothetical protein